MNATTRAKLDRIDSLIAKHIEANRQERHYRLLHAHDTAALAESRRTTERHNARINALCTKYDRIAGYVDTSV